MARTANPPRRARKGETKAQANGKVTTKPPADPPAEAETVRLASDAFNALYPKLLDLHHQLTGLNQLLLNARQKGENADFQTVVCPAEVLSRDLAEKAEAMAHEWNRMTPPKETSLSRVQECQLMYYVRLLTPRESRVLLEKVIEHVRFRNSITGKGVPHGA